MSIKNGYVFNKDSIEYLCKIVRNVATTPEIISDLALASNSTFSSVKIDSLIKQAIQDSNDHTDRVVSALTRLVVEKIDFAPTLDNTKTKINSLLLYSANNDTNFHQYLRLENELLDLGTTSIDLSSYYTITQADSKFVLKTDYDSLVDAINDINDTLGDEALTTTSQTVTEAINELVESRTNMEIIDLQGESVLDFAKTFNALTYNSFYANNCYDLPNNENYGYCYVEVSQDPLYRNINFTSPTTGRKYTNTIGASTADPTIFGMWSGWHEELIREDVVNVLDNSVTDEQIPSAKVAYNELGKKIDKASITTVLDDTVTDEQVPSAKAVFSTIIDKKGECTTIRHTDLDTVKKGGLYYVQSSCTNLPYNCVGGYMCVIYNDELADTYATQIMLNWNGKKIYFRSLISGTWLNWDIINTTKVEDVGVTELKWTNTTNYEPHGTKCHYTVKNGICYISLDIAVHTPSNAGFILNNSGLPKPAFNYVHANISPYSSTDATLRTLTIAITEASQFVIYNGTAGARYLQTFSYPVAE